MIESWNTGKNGLILLVKLSNLCYFFLVLTWLKWNRRRDIWNFIGFKTYPSLTELKRGQVISALTLCKNMVGENSGVGGWPSRGWWVTVLGMVGDCPYDIGWSSWGWRVTLLGMVDDRSWDGGWLSWDWGLGILGKVGDYSWEGGWPSLGWWSAQGC